MPYIKLTRKQWGDTQVSLSVPTSAEVEYKQDEWVGPPDWLAKEGMGLCIFADAESAARYLRLMQSIFVQIWECEAEGVRVPHRRPETIVSLAFQLLNQPAVSDWPKGTLFADRVKLTKQLTHKELFALAKEQEGTDA